MMFVEEFQRSLNGNRTRVLSVGYFCYNTGRPLHYHRDDSGVVYRYYNKYLLMTSMLIISLNHWMRPHTSSTKKWSKVGELSPPSQEWVKQYIYIYIYYLENTEIRRSVRMIKIPYIRIPKFLKIHVTKHTKTKQSEYLLNPTVRYVNDRSRRHVTQKVSHS